jgi:predicted metal-binding membrane protein
VAGAPVVTATSAGMLVAGSAAWVLTIFWAGRSGTGAMPGTAGMAFGSFVAMWAVMMAAMMLPSVAPMAALYARTITRRRPARVSAFGAGYVLAWAATGVLAYLLAGGLDNLVVGRPTMGRLVGSAMFAACGVYQLTSLKDRCLGHCRTPFAHLLRYMSFRGATRDLRAGAHHGLYCLGCCWALMLLILAFGVMNLVAVAALATVVAVEKRWRHGRSFARAVGIVSLAWAVAALAEPALTPGLHAMR